MDWSDSASYVGDWELGYASGKGVFTDCLGNRYVGQFRLSMAHGKGTYTNTLGAIYEGEWRFDMQHGQGTEKWLNSNSVFTGHFVDGLRNGPGVKKKSQKTLILAFEVTNHHPNTHFKLGTLFSDFT